MLLLFVVRLEVEVHATACDAWAELPTLCHIVTTLAAGVARIAAVIAVAVAGVASAAPCLALAVLDGGNQVATPLTCIGVLINFVGPRLC